MPVFSAFLKGWVPILIYHRVADSVKPADDPYHNTITLAQFDRQMALLHHLGYQTISLNEVVRALDQSAAVKKKICLTFDDGYEDNYTNAWPILGKYNFRATIFLVSDYVGKSNHWDQQRGYASVPLMDWTKIQEMQRHGFDFGAHSSTHPHLTQVDDRQLVQEIEGSGQRIAEQLGQPVNFFCYPHYAADHRVMEAVERAGYLGATGGRKYPYQRYYLNRIDTVQDPEFSFRFKISGLYQWLRTNEAIRNIRRLYKR